MVLDRRYCGLLSSTIRNNGIMFVGGDYPFSKTTSGTISPFMLFNVVIVVTLSCARKIRSFAKHISISIGW